jgi:hypothetical protein
MRRQFLLKALFPMPFLISPLVSFSLIIQPLCYAKLTTGGSAPHKTTGGRYGKSNMDMKLIVNKCNVKYPFKSVSRSMVIMQKFKLMCHNFIVDIISPLPSSIGRSSWDPGFDSRRYQLFWEAVCLVLSLLSLTRITQELLELKVALPSRKVRLWA